MVPSSGERGISLSISLWTLLVAGPSVADDMQATDIERLVLDLYHSPENQMRANQSVSLVLSSTFSH